MRALDTSALTNHRLALARHGTQTQYFDLCIHPPTQHHAKKTQKKALAMGAETREKERSHSKKMPQNMQQHQTSKRTTDRSKTRKERSSNTVKSTKGEEAQNTRNQNNLKGDLSPNHQCSIGSPTASVERSTPTDKKSKAIITTPRSRSVYHRVLNSNGRRWC